MSAKKCLVILGTRPEVIKMGPVIRALEADARAECVVCLTGQHEELLESALSLFQIEARYRLRVMVHGQGLACLTARLLAELESVIKRETPDWVLVQGDTTSALAGSLAAFYAQVPVAHIEAGLRSNERDQPFPEEINRKLIDTIAAMHFAPTVRDQRALLREGIDADSIYICGNTGIDALHYVSGLPMPLDLARRYGIEKRIVLVTAHRRENHGVPMEGICRGLRTFAERYPDAVQLIVPVHPNQGVSAPFHRILGDVPNVTLSEPLGYQEMIAAVRASYFVMTDSGGLQEELPSLGKPALVLRNVTDRAESVDAGSAKLVGTDPEMIVAAATELMENPEHYRQMATRRPLFGDGNAAERIVHALLEPAGVRKAELLHFYDRGQSKDTAVRLPLRHLPRRRSGD